MLEMQERYKGDHLYSFESNKFIKSQIYEHFAVNYSYKTKYGFLSVGWRIIIEAESICLNDHSKLSFQTKTFSSKDYEIQEIKVCCNNVCTYSVRGYSYDCGNVDILQKKIDNKIKKQKELEKENEELDRKLNDSNDNNWIEDKLKQVLTNEEAKYSNNINFNIKKEINKIKKIKIIKN